MCVHSSSNLRAGPTGALRRLQFNLGLFKLWGWKSLLWYRLWSHIGYEPKAFSFGQPSKGIHASPFRGPVSPRLPTSSCSRCHDMRSARQHVSPTYCPCRTRESRDLPGSIRKRMLARQSLVFEFQRLTGSGFKTSASGSKAFGLSSSDCGHGGLAASTAGLCQFGGQGGRIPWGLGARQ